jgi:flavocytochrome c
MLSMNKGHKRDSSINLSEEFDIVIIGSGFSGLAAAIEAYDSGSSVVLLEKRKQIGGNSIIAWGCINAVYPSRQQAQDIDDSVEKHTEQTLIGGGSVANPERIRAVVAEGENTIRWLTDIGVTWMDEIKQGYGSLWPRSHMPVGRGKAIVEKMHEQIKNRNIPILFEHRVRKLIRNPGNEGEVVGVEVQVDGDLLLLRARKAVVLASGGFASDDWMIAKHNFRFGKLLSTGIKEATGELLIASQNIGADVVGMDYIQTVPKAYDVRTGERYTTRLVSYADIPHIIHINWKGERIVNSDARRDEIANAILGQPENCSFIVADDKVREIKQISSETAWNLAEKGLIFGGRTIEELAENMGVLSSTLSSTIRRFNSFVENKNDQDFHQSVHMLVNKIEKSPFWATLVSMARHYTCGGLRVGGKMWTQVLDRSGNIIPRFYAAGEVTGGFHGTNRLGCNATLECIVAGRWAGISASNEQAITY